MANKADVQRAFLSGVSCVISNMAHTCSISGSVLVGVPIDELLEYLEEEGDTQIARLVRLATDFGMDNVQVKPASCRPESEHD